MMILLKRENIKARQLVNYDIKCCLIGRDQRSRHLMLGK